LHTFQDKKFEEDTIIVNGHAPFTIVVSKIEFILGPFTTTHYLFPGADSIEPDYPTIMLIPHQLILQAKTDTASNPASSTQPLSPDHPTAAAVLRLCDR
jgi:hypothetical protein